MISLILIQILFPLPGGKDFPLFWLGGKFLFWGIFNNIKY